MLFFDKNIDVFVQTLHVSQIYFLFWNEWKSCKSITFNLQVIFEKCECTIWGRKWILNDIPVISGPFTSTVKDHSKSHLEHNGKVATITSHFPRQQSLWMTYNPWPLSIDSEGHHLAINDKYMCAHVAFSYDYQKWIRQAIFIPHPQLLTQLHHLQRTRGVHYTGKNTEYRVFVSIQIPLFFLAFEGENVECCMAFAT